MFTLMRSASASKAEVKLLRKRTLDSDIVMNITTASNLYTGFNNSEHYQVLLDFLEPDFKHIRFPGDKPIQLAPNNCVLMTFSKYKLDTPQEDLALR